MLLHIYRGEAEGPSRSIEDTATYASAYFKNPSNAAVEENGLNPKQYHKVNQGHRPASFHAVTSTFTSNDTTRFNFRIIRFEDAPKAEGRVTLRTIDLETATATATAAMSWMVM
jgi:hypothetical protein